MQIVPKFSRVPKPQRVCAAFNLQIWHEPRGSARFAPVVKAPVLHRVGEFNDWLWLKSPVCFQGFWVFALRETLGARVKIVGHAWQKAEIWVKPLNEWPSS